MLSQIFKFMAGRQVSKEERARLAAERKEEWILYRQQAALFSDYLWLSGYNTTRRAPAREFYFFWARPFLRIAPYILKAVWLVFDFVMAFLGKVISIFFAFVVLAIFAAPLLMPFLAWLGTALAAFLTVAVVMVCLAGGCLLSLAPVCGVLLLVCATRRIRDFSTSPSAVRLLVGLFIGTIVLFLVSLVGVVIFKNLGTAPKLVETRF